MQKDKNNMIFKILLCLVIFQLENCTGGNTTMLEQESSVSKPFGSLEDDWKRLDLLQSLQPKNSVLRADLVKACRLLLNALYQSTSLNSIDEFPAKPASFDRNYSNSYKNATKIQDGDRSNEVIVPTERFFKLYNGSEYNNVTNLQNFEHKLKPMINSHENVLGIRTENIKRTTLLPFYNVGLTNNNNGNNIFENNNTLNAFDKPVDVGFGSGTNLCKADSYNSFDRNNKTQNHVHREMKHRTNSSARCGKTDKFKFPAHEFNSTDTLSTTESEMSLQYFNINIFQNTYIGSTTNSSINNGSRLAPTEVIPLRSDLEDRSLVGKIGVTNKKHDSCDSLLSGRNENGKSNVEKKIVGEKSLSNYNRNDSMTDSSFVGKIVNHTLKYIDGRNENSSFVGKIVNPTSKYVDHRNINSSFVGKIENLTLKNVDGRNENSSFIGKIENHTSKYVDYRNINSSFVGEIKNPTSKNVDGRNENPSFIGKIRDPTLKNIDKIVDGGSNSLTNSGKEIFPNSVKDPILNTSVFSNGILDLNDNLHQELDSLDKNQGVLLTFNDKVLPNITAVNNGQLVTVPQEQVEQIADLDRVVQKFLDSLYNGSINVKKEDGSMLQDNNILILQGNLTDEKNLGAVSGEMKENLKNPTTNQSGVMSIKVASRENLKPSSGQIDKSTRENLKQPSNNLNSNQSSSFISRENDGERLQMDRNHSSSYNVTVNKEINDKKQVNLKPEPNAKLEESSSKEFAGDSQGNSMHPSNIDSRIVDKNNLKQLFGAHNNELHDTITESLLENRDAMFGLENSCNDKNTSSLSTFRQHKNNISGSRKHDTIEEDVRQSSLKQNNELENLSGENCTTNLTTSNNQSNLTNLKNDYDGMKDGFKNLSSNFQSNGLNSNDNEHSSISSTNEKSYPNHSNSLKSDDNLINSNTSSTNESLNKLAPSNDDELKANLTVPVSSFYQSEKLANSGVYDDINNMKKSPNFNESNAFTKNQNEDIKNNLIQSKYNDLSQFNSIDDVMKNTTASNNSVGFMDSKNKVDKIEGSQLFSNNSNNKLINKDKVDSITSPINQRQELVSLARKFSNNVQLDNKNDSYNRLSSKNYSNLTAEEAINEGKISLKNSNDNEKSSKLHSNSVDEDFGKSKLTTDHQTLSNKASQCEDHLGVSAKHSDALISDASHKQVDHKFITSMAESNESNNCLTNSSRSVPLSTCGETKEKLNNDKSTVNKDISFNEKKIAFQLGEA